MISDYSKKKHQEKIFSCTFLNLLTWKVKQEEHNNQLEELNELIKSHLLPVSEAAFGKYRNFFQLNKKTFHQTKEHVNSNDTSSKTSETTSESAVSSMSSSPLSSQSPSSSFSDNNSSSSNTNHNKCTFCNILKNLLDLHQFLHKI